MKVLITGGQGFLGGHLRRKLHADGVHSISISTRTHQRNIEVEQYVIPELGRETNWEYALKDKDIVVHCAAVLPSAHLTVFDKKTIYKVNTEGTLRLAQQAAAMGVKRFIFVSSIAVNGQQTVKNFPFRARDLPNPVGVYGFTKLEAERGVSLVASERKMDFVVLRAPALYGPGMKGSVNSLANLISLGVPLPIRGVQNKRSFLSVDNFISVLIECLTNERCRNKVLLVSDKDDVSIEELANMIADLKQTEIRTFHLPRFLIDALTKSKMTRNLSHSLFSNLEIDSGPTFDLLSLKPKQTLKEGLRCCFP